MYLIEPSIKSPKMRNHIGLKRTIIRSNGLPKRGSARVLGNLPPSGKAKVNKEIPYRRIIAKGIDGKENRRMRPAIRYAKPRKRSRHKVIKDIMSLNEAPFGRRSRGHKEDICIAQPRTINRSRAAPKGKHYKMKPICVAQQTESANKTTKGPRQDTGGRGQGTVERAWKCTQLE